MSDIVERLRGRVENHASMQGNAAYYTLGCAVLDREAMAEIERLRAALDEQVQWVKDLADSLMEAEGKIGVKNARIEQLEAALREIATYVPDDGCPCSACHHSALARRALGEERT